MDVHGRDLRYFVAVAESRSFTRAAARLFVSQPALSKQVRQLEQQLNARLLLRGPRGVTLTAAGEALLPFAREQLSRWATAEQHLAAAAAVDAEVLTVGFSTAVARGLLSGATDAFRQTHPGWRIQLRQVAWHDPTAGLADARVDVAILWLPLTSPDRYDWQVLVTEPCWVALPATHPLAARPHLNFHDLLDEPFLALPESAGPLRDHWLALDHRAGRPVRVGGTVTTAEETFEAVANGIGIALLSAGNAQIYRHPGVVTRPVTGVSPSHLAVAWRHDDNRTIAADFVKACAAAGPADSLAPADTDRAPQLPPPGGRPQRSHLAVGISGYTDQLQQRVLTELAHTQPPVPIVPQPSDSTRARVHAVQSGDLDLAFARVASSPAPDLDYRHLGTEPLLVAVPRTHHLAEQPPRPAPVPLSALHDQPLAFYHREQNPWWYDDVLSHLDAVGARPDIVHRGLWQFDVLSQVNAGHALALLTPTAAASARLENVVYRRLHPATLSLSHGIVWRRDHDTTVIQRLLQAID